MRKIVIPVLLSLFVFSCSDKVEIPKRTKTPKEPTAIEDSLLHEGVILNDKGDYSGALSIYNRLLKENPDYMAAIYEKAYTYGDLKMYKETLDYCLRGLEYESDGTTMFFSMGGWALRQLNREDESIRFYELAISEDSSYYSPYYNLGLIYLDHNDYNRAAYYVMQSIRLEPYYGPHYLTLGEIRLKESESLMAYLYALKFLMIIPDGENTDEALNIIEASKNEISKAAFFAAFQAFNDLYKRGAELGKKKLQNKDEIKFRLGEFRSALQRVSFNGIKNGVDSVLIDYYTQLRETSNVETFIYYTHQQSGLPGVKEWLKKNNTKVDSLLEWDRNDKYSFGK
jgi:tetratricopeptide (TPR) repeat protein